MTRWRRFAALAGFLVAGGAIAAALAARSSRPEPIDEALIVTATRGPLAIEVIDVGRIEALHQVEIESKVPGRVAEIFVEEGDRIVAGQPLLSLDTRDFSRDLARQRTELAGARARVVFAELDRDRKARGAASGVVARADLDLAEHGVTLAEIEVMAAKVALATARDRFDDARIVAPISGTVIRRAIEAGEMVVPGIESTFEKRSLLTVADLSQLVVEIELNQIDVAQVRVGQRVTLTLDALPSERFEATVREIAAASIRKPGKEVEVFPIEAVLDRTDPRIKPGMTADVRIRVRERPRVVSLPIESVRREGDKAFVTRIVDAEHGPQKQPIEVDLGDRNDRVIEIVSGIDEGARVLIDPPSAAENETKI